MDLQTVQGKGITRKHNLSLSRSEPAHVQMSIATGDGRAALLVLACVIASRNIPHIVVTLDIRISLRSSDLLSCENIERHLWRWRMG